MIVFPNCKINLGLRTLDKRADGFHNLETIFYPIPLKDSLEIIRAKESQQELVQFTQSGNAVDGNPEDNICIKAYNLLKKDFPQLPAIRLHLHKAIPMGAGLGGGSADGAFTLQLLNQKFQLNLSTEQLVNYSLILGSDCPFFILNKPCLATGRGEVLELLDFSLKGYRLVLVNPGIHINTGWAFRQLGQLRKGVSVAYKMPLKMLMNQPFSTWKDELTNDFETVVFTAHPPIKQIKDFLYDQGALYAAMSGSGSTVFGLFEKVAVLDFNFPAEYFTTHFLL